MRTSGGAVEVFLARDLEAERQNLRFARAPQHNRMVVSFLDAAEVERVCRLVADQQTEAVNIEGARAAEIADPKLDMAGANDVEGRGEDRIVDWHCSPGVDGFCADF